MRRSLYKQGVRHSLNLENSEFSHSLDPKKAFTVLSRDLEKREKEGWIKYAADKLVTTTDLRRRHDCSTKAQAGVGA
jgi:hypothetical protein